MLSRSQRLSLSVVALVATSFAATSFTTLSSPIAAQIEPPEPPPVGPVPSDSFARDRAAVARLGDRLSTVASRHRLDGTELRTLLLSDPTLAVDGDGALVYIDPPAPEEEPVIGALDTEPGGDEPDASVEVDADDDVEADDADVDDDAEADDGSVFELASLPGADKTIHLDFDGHTIVGTRWNAASGVSTIESPAFDLDGDPSSWSTEELDAIASTWAAVAEDFDPWNVNVTTIEPPVDALRRSGDDDPTSGARVVFTTDTFASCGCGGLTYVGGFDAAEDEPTFVFSTTTEILSEVATHQVGHLLGLAHDGTTIGTTTHRDLTPRNDGSDGSGDGSAGDGVSGDDSTGATDQDAPAPPSGAIGVEVDGAVFLGWAPNADDDLAGYLVRWSTDPDGPYQTIATTTVNGFVDPSPDAGDNHYLVVATDRSGNRSEPATLTIAVTGEATS